MNMIRKNIPVYKNHLSFFPTHFLYLKGVSYERRKRKKTKIKIFKNDTEKREMVANKYCYRNSGKSDKILQITNQIAKTRGIKRNINFVFLI